MHIYFLRLSLHNRFDLVFIYRFESLFFTDLAVQDLNEAWFSSLWILSSLKRGQMLRNPALSALRLTVRLLFILTFQPAWLRRLRSTKDTPGSLLSPRRAIAVPRRLPDLWKVVKLGSCRFPDRRRLRGVLVPVERLGLLHLSLDLEGVLRDGLAVGGQLAGDYQRPLVLIQKVRTAHL